MHHLPDTPGDLAAENAALRRRVAALEAELAARPERAADLGDLAPLLASVLEQLPVGVAIAAAPSGRLIFHNAEAVRLLRHPLRSGADYLGYAQYGARHPDGRPYAPAEYPIARALLHESVVPDEDMIYQRGDGTPTTFAVNAAPIRDAGGRFVAVVSTFRDVAAQHELETALRESEQRFAASFHGSPIALVLSIAADGRILDVNDRFLELFGRPRAGVIGQSSLAIGMWDDPDDRRRAVEALQRDGRVRGLEVVIRGAGDAPRHVLLSVEPLTVADTPCLLTALYDITERVHAEAALRASEARFHNTIDGLLEGVQIIDFDWRYRYLNDSAVAQARQPRGALLGRTVTACFPGIETTGLFAALRRCMDERVPIWMENRFDYADGASAWFDLSIQPGPEGIVILSVDSTARKRAELELRYAADRLQLLADASRAFAEMGVDYQALLERIARLTGDQLVAACVIRLRSDDGQWLDAATIYDRDADAQRRARAFLAGARMRVDDPTPSAAVARDGQPRFMRTIDPAAARGSAPDIWSTFERWQPISAILVPLQLQGRNIGVLAYTRHEPGQLPFGEDDLTLAQDLADRAALAIGGARLYAELQAANAELERRVQSRTAELRQHAARATALAELGQALAEVGLDDAALFDTIARRVVELVGEACTIAVRSADERWLETKAVAHVDSEAQALLRALAATPYPIDAGLAGQVARTGAALRLADLEPERVEANPTYQRYIERYGMAQVLIVPLRVNGRAIGTLGVSRGRGAPPYTDADETFLQQIADRAALAIEHARLFAEARQARAEAERASRAKSVFLASLSHELRTPLNAIIGFTGTLLMRLPGPLNAAQEKQLATIQRSGQHLLALINDLLDLAKIESGKVQISRVPVACQEVVAAVAASLRPLAEQKGLGLGVDLPAEPIVLLGDARALTQILTNLIGNAIKFTDAGEVSIALRRTTDDRSGSASAAGPASFVAFEVRDTGIGIKPEDQARLFQEFGRIDSDEVRAREGTGLGLRLAHQLAALLGGRIAVESAYGAGSTFTLSLPA